ncbi:MAG: acetyl-CoA carboxylase carboxyltransferase subunit beta [Flavobacteriales bacterium]|jgi:acetyl-CoA carboxylase carboxyl transferase subunit beta|nr:acetyl-CoA carboxylase carboxyltransferase subunit beta [Flavobacteriales bacterium]MBT5932837.1 acetyl-CoA carboxylase carboxyltransferase subunit beta [Flavobacteriales bacterium]MDB4340159.1 acetyl-CoA carboxylase, carboxyltransferase subunit beta [Crocinitomicaceae bacterium]MDC0302299.1 acetyl-CoA carboxylase, carboxyltransferase subunit beta [bacterium]MDO7613492.1 acetyl-CoA carboxylase, carboxyltransferase subunit beta [Crocinitomicaceae bacterium]
MSWFKRNKEGITTTTSEKKEVPEGLWSRCSNCKTIFTKGDLEKLNYVCNRCSHHERIGSEEYFSIIFDDGKYTELNPNITSGDPLSFEDTKKYTDRLKTTQKNTGLSDAVRTAKGKLNKKDFIVAAMDFKFIGGSMGSVMGEKIARAIDEALKLKCPIMIISKSGGARMMEAGFSLMQMAKISGKLGQLADAQLPYISYLTDPTTGGVTASFAMLGDVNIAEPGALIAFAGPRVVKETIGRDLPEGFQTSEFLLEHGFLDFIVERTDIRDKLTLVVDLFTK